MFYLLEEKGLDIRPDSTENVRRAASGTCYYCDINFSTVQFVSCVYSAPLP